MRQSERGTNMHDGRNDFNRYMNKPRYKGSIEKVDRIKELENG